MAYRSATLKYNDSYENWWVISWLHLAMRAIYMFNIWLNLFGGIYIYIYTCVCVNPLMTVLIDAAKWRAARHVT